MRYLIFVIFLSIMILAFWMLSGGSRGMSFPQSSFLESSSRPLEGSIDEGLLKKIDSAYE